MTMRSGFNMHHSNLQGFLSATVWDEKNGSSLSLLSALARLGLDPWREAAQLADMPRTAAATALSSILAQLPGNDLKSSDQALLSQRLVQFLPEGGSRLDAEQQGTSNQQGKDSKFQQLAIGIALSALVIAMQMNGWLF